MTLWINALLVLWISWIASRVRCGKSYPLAMGVCFFLAVMTLGILGLFGIHAFTLPEIGPRMVALFLLLTFVGWATAGVIIARAHLKQSVSDWKRRTG